jgi:hypothetical protein
LSSKRSKPNKIPDREQYSIVLNERLIQKYITVLSLLIEYKLKEGSFTQKTVIELLELFRNSMSKKLSKVDCVVATEIIDNHFFVESDKGNFIAIKKNDSFNTVVLEGYEGTAKSYLDEWELSRPKGRPKNGCFGDLFSGVVKYLV